MVSVWHALRTVGLGGAASEIARVMTYDRMIDGCRLAGAEDRTTRVARVVDARCYGDRSAMFVWTDARAPQPHVVLVL